MLCDMSDNTFRTTLGVDHTFPNIERYADKTY